MCDVDAYSPSRRTVDDGESMPGGADVRGRDHDDRPSVKNGNATRSVAELRKVIRSGSFGMPVTQAPCRCCPPRVTPGFIYTVTTRVTGHLPTTRSVLR